MINLLPPDIKAGYHYARRNVGLRSWVIALFAALVGLGILATYGSLTLHQSTNDYTQQVAAANNQLQEEHLTQTEQQVKDMTGSLRLAVQVLSQEVLFSKLITQIGAAMPSGAILTGLDINQASGGLDLTASSTNYTTATQVQVNLGNATSGIFAKVDIISISCSANSSADPKHPCSVQLRALFNTNNQFLFINQGAQP